MATNPSYFMQQLFTDAGAVATGYLLDTFLSGTTTPETTWQDAAGSTANANPIVLDASGRCTIFVDPTKLYTFRLRTPGGATVWTRDSIAGLPVTSATQFVPLAGGVTMTGLFNLSGNATGNLNPTPLQQVNSLIAASAASLTTSLGEQVPVGTIALWLTGAPPADWLHLDGGVASRATYPDLFALWGITFGAGNGSTTFGLPEVRGEFPRFWDGGRGIDASRAIATAQAEMIGPHTHPYVATSNGNPGGAEGGARDSAGHGISYTTSANTGTENRPRNFSFMAIVRGR